MKKIAISIIIFFIIITSIMQNLVKAEDNKVEPESTTYEISKIGMTIKIPSNFYDIIQGLEKNDEKVSEYQGAKQNLKKMGIMLNAVESLDENSTEEIIVVVSKNNITTQLVDIDNIPEEQMEKFSNSFFETIKQQATGLELIEEKVIDTGNGNKYMAVTTKSSIEQNTINTVTYYTIKNQLLIGITNKYLNKEIDTQKVRKYNRKY